MAGEGSLSASSVVPTYILSRTVLPVPVCGPCNIQASHREVLHVWFFHLGVQGQLCLFLCIVTTSSPSLSHPAAFTVPDWDTLNVPPTLKSHTDRKLKRQRDLSKRSPPSTAGWIPVLTFCRHTLESHVALRCAPSQLHAEIRPLWEGGGEQCFTCISSSQAFPSICYNNPNLSLSTCTWAHGIKPSNTERPQLVLLMRPNRCIPTHHRGAWRHGRLLLLWCNKLSQQLGLRHVQICDENPVLSCNLSATSSYYTHRVEKMQLYVHKSLHSGTVRNCLQPAGVDSQPFMVDDLFGKYRFC